MIYIYSRIVSSRDYKRVVVLLELVFDYLLTREYDRNECRICDFSFCSADLETMQPLYYRIVILCVVRDYSLTSG